ncbi:MAG: hypothetical protein ACRD11_03715, partial [Terriglobia bacterium]
LKFRRGGNVAKVAVARHLAVRLGRCARRALLRRRFARQAARRNPWWMRIHRPPDWALGLPPWREIEERIMVG